MAKSTKRKPTVKKIIQPIAETTSLPVYTASLKCLGKRYTGTGASVIDAVKNLPIRVARGMSVLSIEREGKVQTHVMSAVITKRLFGNIGHLAKEIAHKQLLTRFDL